MTLSRLGVRLSAMLIIPWIRSTIGVVLPWLIDTFDLTISQAGLVSVFIESGTVTGMLTLGFVIDRLGAARVVGWGIPAIGAALLVVTVIPTFTALAPILFILGIGIALTASGINALMASTGARRGFYLGVLHSAFSLFAIVTPLVAGVILVMGTWQTYYRLVAALALLVMILFWIIERPNRQEQEATTREVESGAPVYGTGTALKRIATVCLGVFALSGVQSIFITWSYLYMIKVYGVGHSLATLAPSLLWLGIFVARSGTIGLSRRFSARTILLCSITLSVGVLSIEYAFPSFMVTSAVLVVMGIGVGGAYQLGTAWAAERIPDRVGTASTFIMASASCGIGVWPWLTGVIIDATSFSSMMFVALAGFIVAAAMFSVTRAPR